MALQIKSLPLKHEGLSLVPQNLHLSYSLSAIDRKGQRRGKPQKFPGQLSWRSTSEQKTMSQTMSKKTNSPILSKPHIHAMTLWNAHTTHTHVHIWTLHTYTHRHTHTCTYYTHFYTHTYQHHTHINLHYGHTHGHTYIMDTTMHTHMHGFFKLYFKAFKSYLKALGLESSSTTKSSYCSCREPGLGPQHPSKHLTIFVNSSSRIPHVIFWSPRALPWHAQTHTRTYIHA